MGLVSCSACNNDISDQATSCPKCGHPRQVVQTVNVYSGIGVKSRVAAGVLGIVLGGIGAHKFYMGKVGQGFLYLIFFWTLIPGIVGLIEGILYLTQSDEVFSQKQGIPVAPSR
jgi:hypothetical protein